LKADHLARFHFLGQMIGVALREGILVELPLASFFLTLLLGRVNFGSCSRSRFLA
jgi:hypothetical protein